MVREKHARYLEDHKMAGPDGVKNPRRQLLFEMGLCPLEEMRCETWDLDDEVSVELFASFEIPTNILVKFDKIPD